MLPRDIPAGFRHVCPQVMSASQKHRASEAPAGPVPTAGGVPVAEKLLLLTHDQSLIEALIGVVPADSLSVVSEEVALASQVVSGRVGVVFIDADAPHSPPGATAQLIRRLHQELPDVVLVVAGDGAEQSELAALVTDGTIYRFVHKPVSAQRLKLFVDAAWRKREGASASGAYPAVSMPQLPATAQPPRVHPWPAVLAGVLFTGAAAGWLLLRPDSPAPPAPPAPIPVPAAPVPAAPAPAPKPTVAASVTTATDTVFETSAARGGPPSSTPPVSEARDPNSVAAVILQRTYSVDPVFPDVAREGDLTGFVDLEFMVRADGSVADVTVLKAQPVGVFESSAVAAVRQWHYRPVERDGVPVDEHARLRLNFGYK